VAPFGDGVASEVTCRTLPDQEPFDRSGTGGIFVATGAGLYSVDKWQTTEAGWRKATAGKPLLPGRPRPSSRHEKDEEGEVRETVKQKTVKVGGRPLRAWCRTHRVTMFQPADTYDDERCYANGVIVSARDGVNSTVFELTLDAAP
jgi:hypothetical protein